MSMISEQIKQLESVRDIIRYNPDEDGMYRLKAEAMVEILDSAIDTIKTLSAKVADENMERSSQYYNGEWIPCSEKNPPDYGNYLATMNDGDVQEVAYDDKFEIWSTCEADGYKRLKDYDIVAWQKLPKPYKGE